MDDREYYIRLFKNTQPKLLFPNDKRSQNAWQVYEPSFFTQVLTSEQNRQLYAEAFAFPTDSANDNTKADPIIKADTPNKVETPIKEETTQNADTTNQADIPDNPDDSTNIANEEKTEDVQQEKEVVVVSEKHENLHTALPLKQIILQLLLNAYKGGPFNENVQLSDKVWIGENLNVDMPVEDIVDLDNIVFWRRVVEAKCTDKTKLAECCRDDNFDWKFFGVELKLKIIYETTSRESWNEEKMAKLSKAVSPYVFELNIEQLVGVNANLVEKNQYNPLYKIFNFPPKDCHHGNLGAALGHLTNLRSLTLQFGIKTLQYQYELRLFEMSYTDVENLACGLSKLANLRTLIVTRSRLDDRKCKTLVSGLVSCSLESLELSNCHLEDLSGKAIGFYLQNCPNTLKSLELRDNYITGSGLLGIGFGIQEYTGELEYIGLAGNPIGESGLVALGSGFCEREQVKRIDISRCDIRGEGPFRLIQMIGFHVRLESLQICCVHIGDQIGESLVAVLKGHWNLVHLGVHGCGLTENQQRKIKMILARNKFYIKNPCMRKEYFEEKDAIEIDKWIAKPKHPILLRVFERHPSPERCNEYEPRNRIVGEHIPTFITESQRRVASTSEILDIKYMDCNEDDPPELEIANPNKFTQLQFNTSMKIGNSADFSSKQYFQ